MIGRKEDIIISYSFMKLSCLKIEIRYKPLSPSGNKVDCFKFEKFCKKDNERFNNREDTMGKH